uniref:Uncharacterized protein n=1 Tax=Arundo donax TaxID=35708 RepID=A0A0A9E8Q7_ARUDO
MIQFLSIRLGTDYFRLFLGDFPRQRGCLCIPLVPLLLPFNLLPANRRYLHLLLS